MLIFKNKQKRRNQKSNLAYHLRIITRREEIRNLVLLIIYEFQKKRRNQKSTLVHHLRNFIRREEIRNLLSSFHSLTRPSLVEIDQKIRNQKSTFQFTPIDWTIPCWNRPEKQKSEIYFPVYTYWPDHPLFKTIRKAEIRNLLSSLHLLTRPPFVQNDQKSRNQKFTFQFTPIDWTTPVEINQKSRNQKFTFQFTYISTISTNWKVDFWFLLFWLISTGGDLIKECKLESKFLISAFLIVLNKGWSSQWL
jgi:hypothetical protein